VLRVATALRAGAEAADGTGRPLFSGLAAQPWPDDPAGVLWRGCELLREHRGDSHVAVCTAAGHDAVEMNVLTELWLDMPLASYSATRGWSPAQLDGAVARLTAAGLLDSAGGLTPPGRRHRSELEERTDALEGGLVDGIGPAIDEVLGRLTEWSDACVAARAFPPDVFKRAAG
jgi:hypothetical protein